jgi:hypothetical protein
VFCQLDTLKRCRKKKTLLEALESLPKTLDDTYERILTNIDKDYQEEARRALMWLAFSLRPLRIEEVAEAAVVDPERDTPFDPEERLHDPCNDIVEILGSLVTVSWKSVSGDASSDASASVWDAVSDSTSGGRPGEDIRLAHFSVKEYLLSDRIEKSSASGFKATSVEADYFISASCLLYILHYDGSDSKATSPDDLECFPLLQYACEFWYTHAKFIPVESRESIDCISSKFFLSDTALAAWLQVHRPNLIQEPFSFWEEASLPLYYASYIGLEAVVRVLLEHKAEVDAKDRYGRMALHGAAARGREAVVRVLLEYKADVDAKDRYGRTALLWAANRGHGVVVRLLLEHKADVGAKDRYGRTALLLAAEGGHGAVVQLLLEHKADVNAKDEAGRTALHGAAAWGHGAVVRLLEAQEKSR